MKSFNTFRNEYLEEGYLTEKNKPTSPEKWARAKAQAKSKFAVYPSAYANAWAAKKYKSMGGGWRATSEEYVTEGRGDSVIKTTAKSLDDNAVHIFKLKDAGIPASQGAGAGHHIIVPPEHEAKAKELLAGNLKEEVEQIDEKSAAWQRKEGKSEAGGLNRKGIASYRRENPGSKLSMAVTTKPSKLKPGSKAANRRKSFCARMGGMKKRLTSAKTARDPDSRINKALRKWNC